MSAPLKRFIETNPREEMLSRWREYQAGEHPSVGAGPIPETFIPFFGTPFFSKLSDSQKRRLYLDFIQLNAEGNVLFERLLLYAFRKHGHFQSAEGEASLRKLLHEELLHTQAFRRFLRQDPSFEWPQHDLMTRERFLVRALCAAVDFAPLALLLWAVKIEAYSMTYGNGLKRAFGSWEHNRWTRLHHLHLLDEAHHLPLQLDLYKDGFSLARPIQALKTVVGFFWIILLMQGLLVCGSYKMITRSFSGRSGLMKFFLVFRLARWNVRQFEPYRQARDRVRAVYREKRPMFRLIYSILYW